MFINLGSATFFSQLPRWKEAMVRHTMLFVIQQIGIVQASAGPNAETSCRVVQAVCTCAVRDLAGSMAMLRKRTCVLSWSWPVELSHPCDDCNEKLAS